MGATNLEAGVACGSTRLKHEQEWHGYQLDRCLECFMTFTLNSSDETSVEMAESIKCPTATRRFRSPMSSTIRLRSSWLRAWRVNSRTASASTPKLWWLRSCNFDASLKRCRPSGRRPSVRGCVGRGHPGHGRLVLVLSLDGLELKPSENHSVTLTR
jgi:hypothetical protein